MRFQEPQPPGPGIGPACSRASRSRSSDYFLLVESREPCQSSFAAAARPSRISTTAPTESGLSCRRSRPQKRCAPRQADRIRLSRTWVASIPLRLSNVKAKSPDRQPVPLQNGRPSDRPLSRCVSRSASLTSWSTFCSRLESRILPVVCFLGGKITYHLVLVNRSQHGTTESVGSRAATRFRQPSIGSPYAVGTSAGATPVSAAVYPCLGRPLALLVLVTLHFVISLRVLGMIPREPQHRILFGLGSPARRGARVALGRHFSTFF